MDVSSTQYQLYPEIEPHERGMLDLDGHHTMYWEVSGNPEGVPVVFAEAADLADDVADDEGKGVCW